MADSGITKWEPDKLKEAIKADMMERLQMAAEVVEGQARTNLTRVNEPAWGRKYRWHLAFDGLDVVTETEGGDLVASVGMKRTQTFEEETKTSKHFGFYIEVGSRKWPARHWLRRAFYNNLRNIAAILGAR